MKPSPLRPGLLVSVRTALKGNVKYSTLELEAEHVTLTGEARARWETEKTVRDPAEHERGIKARSKARSLVQCVCAQSEFGLLCPTDKRDQLERVLDEADAVVREFNLTADVSRLSFNVVIGEVMQDDARAIRAINQEMRDLVDAMASGLRTLDVTVVREAANKARSVSQMLAPDAQETVKAAIDLARKTAREIVKAAEVGSAEIDEAAIRKLSEARTQFLDLSDDGQDLGAVEAVGRGIDLDDTPIQDAASPFATSILFE